MSDATNTLDEMCELVIDCPHFTPEWTTSGYLVIRNQNIRDGRLDLSERSYTHLVDFERRIRRAKPRAGDIIFTREAPMGEVCLVPEGLECCVGQRQVLLRPGKGIDHRYLFYALRSPAVRHQIFWNEGTGSTVSNVRIPVLKAIKIPRMGHAEEGIGELLGSLDDKIDLNRRMNETLEEMAQAIFRDWFVDFGPVRRKMAGVTDPVVIMGGLITDANRAPEVAALIPDALGDDDLPVGWQLLALSDVADQTKGSTNPQALPDTVFEHYSLPAYDSGQEPAMDLGVTIKSNKVPVPAGSVMLSKLNPEIPRVWIPNAQAGLPQIASTEFLVFKPRLGCGRGLLYFMFRDPTVRQIMEGMVTGTSKSHQRISPPALLQTKLVVGDGSAFGAFEEIVGPMVERLLALRAENRTLAQTRDYLLPRLMSGEVRVGDAALEIAA